MAKDKKLPVVQTTQSAYSLSRDGSFFAVLAGSGEQAQIKVWDVLSNECLASLSCADRTVCCVEVLSVPGLSSASVVIGSVDGMISIMNVDNGKESETSINLGSRPSCLYQCPHSKDLFVGTVLGDVKVFQICSNGYLSEKETIHFGVKTPIYAVATFGETLAVGQDYITIYDLHSKAVTKTLSGHSSGQVRGITNDGSRIASYSSNDSTIFVWDTESSRTDPLFSATLPKPPSVVSMSSTLLAAVCGNSCILFAGFDAHPSKKVISLDKAAQFQFNPESLLAAFLLENEQLLSIRGSTIVPIFESFNSVAKHGSLPNGTIERDAVITRAKEFKGDQKTKKLRLTSPQVVSGSSAPVRHTPDVELHEKTILEAEVVVNQDDGLKTVTNLLIQALTARNSQLIESALGLNDENIIIESLEKLPEPITIVLLEELVSRVAKKPARVVHLGPWIRCLHAIHGKYLGSLKSYRDVLRPLQDAIALNTESEDLLPALSASLSEALANRVTFEHEGSGDLSVKRADNYVEYLDASSQSDDDLHEPIPDLVSYGAPETDMVSSHEN